MVVICKFDLFGVRESIEKSPWQRLNVVADTWAHYYIN